MSARLAELTARRRRLQDECSLQRGDVRVVYGSLETSVTRVDRVLGIVRSFAPVIVVAGVALLVISGPGRALRLLRQGLSIALYARQAMSFLR